ncbi:MAG TPA: bifunctional 4-hydroxy-2-oxoglutarate aldolase/2-dehydro-3-deoxy-phosphogluconate aldolase [Ilumatobacteraceae bacterium]|nr:bifunctional 4-hydroxy-2-oxoglutarate aldolase/2-dehydro-3-deoxy-phosphogluconate aldolase [Ilumatobacteraceae bacterium]
MTDPASANDWIRRHLGRERVIAILRAESVLDPESLARTLLDAGVATIEVTATTPDHLRVIEVMSAVEGVVVGVGTVLTAAQVHDARAAGARFVVTPVRVPEVERSCADLAVPLITGAMTPTEVHAAAAMAAVVKIFPARSLGPSYVADLLGPFPHLALAPSGGIGPDEVDPYLRAGALAVGLGSIVPARAAASGDHEVIHELAGRARASARAADDAGRPS